MIEILISVVASLVGIFLPVGIKYFLYKKRKTTNAIDILNNAEKKILKSLKIPEGKKQEE